jgi:hypothetical protein
MQIRSQIIFGVVLEGVYSRVHGTLPTNLELLQSGNELALTTMLWESLAGCSMSTDSSSFSVNREVCIKIRYSNKGISEAPLIICSPDYTGNLTPSTFGLTMRAGGPGINGVKEYRNQITHRKVVFSFSTLYGSDIAALFHRWFGLTIDGDNDNHEAWVSPEFSSLQSIADLEKYIVQVDMSKIGNLGGSGDDKTLTQNQLACFTKNSPSIKKSSIFSNPIPIQPNWFDLIKDEQSAEKALFGFFRDESPYVSMTNEQHLSLVTQYPQAASKVLRLKGMEPDRENCCIM